MPTYMVIQAELADREAFQAYAKAVAPLVDQFGGRYVLSARNAHVLEGHDVSGASVVMSEWPDRETAQRFWNSPEYEAAKALREGTGTFHVILVDSEKPVG